MGLTPQKREFKLARTQTKTRMATRTKRMKGAVRQATRSLRRNFNKMGD